MKKFFSKAIFWCWTWYIMSHVADMVTSLARWGDYEDNPYFRDAEHHFMAWHAMLGKSIFTLNLAILSYLAYRLLAPLDKRVAALAACVGPLYFGWYFWGVANNNIFVILHWVSP